MIFYLHRLIYHLKKEFPRPICDLQRNFSSLSHCTWNDNSKSIKSLTQLLYTVSIVILIINGVPTCNNDTCSLLLWKRILCGPWVHNRGWNSTLSTWNSLWLFKTDAVMQRYRVNHIYIKWIQNIEAFSKYMVISFIQSSQCTRKKE